MDISNKFLVVLLVIVIAVTFVGVWVSVDRISRLGALTGYGTEGTVNVTIDTWTETNVTQPTCNFGSGYVTAPNQHATLSSQTSCDDGISGDVKDNWTNTSTYDPDCMEVRNDGNTNVQVNVSSGKDAATMIGGTNPEYKVWSQSKEIGFITEACLTGGAIDYPGTEMDTTNVTVCAELQAKEEEDEMYVGCYLIIPDNAVAGARGDGWTFWATAV